MDIRRVGQAMRRRVGAPSNIADAATAGKAAVRAYRRVGDRVYDEYAESPEMTAVLGNPVAPPPGSRIRKTTYGGQGKNLKRMGGQ